MLKMTRRDYCTVCSELVDDYDPKCLRCACDFHYDCLTTYDSLSRLIIINAKIKIEFEPILSIDELNEIISDISSIQFKDFVYSELKKYELREPFDYIVNKINILIENVKMNLILDEESNVSNVKIVKDFFRDLENLYDIYIHDEFKCIMCHNNVIVSY